jgi:hypothetical protein
VVVVWVWLMGGDSWDCVRLVLRRVLTSRVVAPWPRGGLMYDPGVVGALGNCGVAPIALAGNWPIPMLTE